jgi:hypothetical protein
MPYMKPSVIPRYSLSVIDGQTGDVDNLPCAATIYAMDVPLHPANPYSTQAGDGIKGVRVIWHFHQPDLAGNSPQKIARLFHDTVFQQRNPNDPVTVCANAFREFSTLKQMIHHGRGLQAHYGPACRVTNTRKAAVLIALGHPLLGWIRNPQVTTWCFHEAAAADAALYDDPTLYSKLPDAPISYARGALLGHEAMVDVAKKAQFARVTHRGRSALIGKDISKEDLNTLEKLLYRK